MRGLVLGVGFTTLLAPAAQAAWHKPQAGDAWRTAQANRTQPLVRVVRQYRTDLLPCEQCRIRPRPFKPQRQLSGRAPVPPVQSAVGQQKAQQRALNRAGGWQRSAKVNPHWQRRQHLAKQQAASLFPHPVQMYAYAPPALPAKPLPNGQPQRVHRIAGVAQVFPRCF